MSKEMCEEELTHYLEGREGKPGLGLKYEIKARLPNRPVQKFG